MVDVTEFAALVHLAEHFNRLVIAVANTDVEHLAACICLICHFLGESVVDCNGLLAEDVLVSAKSVHSYCVVCEVRCENENSLNLGVSKSDLIVGDCILNHFVFFLH